MSSALYRLALRAVLWVLWLLRRLISLDGRTYGLMNANRLQWFLARVGRMRAHAAYLKARATSPAYRDLLAEMGYEQKGRRRLDRLPEMTRENYVKKYSIEQRCYGGAIPKAGVVIDESSGFALGPWATGMNVSMSLVEMGILKSIGPDQQKLENTLKLFGPGYRYLIFGYPPFIKAFVDETGLDLSRYQFDLILSGGPGTSHQRRPGASFGGLLLPVEGHRR